MAVFPFTIRATDSEGSFADRQFSITVRNSRVERYMSLTNTDAYTSSDGQTWTLRAGQGGSSCAYGNNMWLIGPNSTGGGMRRSSDGVNYIFIDSANMTFTHLNDPIFGTNMDPVMQSGRISKIRFHNGRFWFYDARGSAITNPGAMRVWYSENGVDWFGRTLLSPTTAPSSNSNVIINVTASGQTVTEDNGVLFLSAATGPSNPVGLHPTIGTGGAPFGFQSTDNGNTWTPVRRAGLAQTVMLNNPAIILTRLNGIYMCSNYGTNAGLGSAARNYIYSTDGSNWTLGDFSVGSGLTTTQTDQLFTRQRPNGYIYANGLIYTSMAAAGAGGGGAFEYMVSADGINWTLRNTMIDFARATGAYGPENGELVYQNGIFIQVHEGGGVVETITVGQYSGGLRFSTNGSTWTTVNRFDNSTTTFTDVSMM